jgi:hypothetical protein
VTAERRYAVRMGLVICLFSAELWLGRDHLAPQTPGSDFWIRYPQGVAAAYLIMGAGALIGGVSLLRKHRWEGLWFAALGLAGVTFHDALGREFVALSRAILRHPEWTAWEATCAAIVFGLIGVFVLLFGGVRPLEVPPAPDVTATG